MNVSQDSIHIGVSKSQVCWQDSRMIEQKTNIGKHFFCEVWTQHLPRLLRQQFREDRSRKT